MPGPSHRPRACTTTRSRPRPATGTASPSPGSRRCARRRRSGSAKPAAPRQRLASRSASLRRAAASPASPGVSRTCSTRSLRAAVSTRPPSSVERDLVTASAAPTLPNALLHTSLAHFHLAQGQPDAALREAQAAGRLVSATIANPYCCDWRSAAALALAALQRPGPARVMAEEELVDARRFGVGEAQGASLRTLGLVLGGADGIGALRQSVAVLEHAEGRLEHARSLLELGSALRRAGIRTEARDVLRAALDESARIAAGGLADRAHDELVAAGARPRRDRRLPLRARVAERPARTASPRSRPRASRTARSPSDSSSPSRRSSGTCATSTASSTSPHVMICPGRSTRDPGPQLWGSACLRHPVRAE